MALLTSIQLRADNVNDGDFFGVNLISNMVPVGAYLGYCYAGQVDAPPVTTRTSFRRAIFFRTYDPATQTFGAQITVKAATLYTDPAGNGAGLTRIGSYWDKPHLVKLTGGRLVCTWGRNDICKDSSSFAPIDTTIYGGGIFASESNDNGLTWSASVQIATDVYAMGPMASDGSEVWIVTQKHIWGGTPNQYTYGGHYAAPTMSNYFLRRTAVDTWAAPSLIYQAATMTRIPGSFGQAQWTEDSFDTHQVPSNNMAVVNSTTGFVIGMRRGISASSSPLTGPGTGGNFDNYLPGTLSSDIRLMCWRTANQGVTWTETAVGTLKSVDPTGGLIPPSMESVTVRLVQTPGGRWYAGYHHFETSAGTQTYFGVFYSDDEGATWTDAGLITPVSIFRDNADLPATLQFNQTHGMYSVFIDTSGFAYITAGSSTEPENTFVWKSTSPVDDDPLTWEYFGYFPLLTGLELGAWFQLAGLHHTDDYVYVLEHLYNANDGGRDELWIEAYSAPTIPVIPDVPESTRMFRRGVIQAQRGKFRNARRAPGSIATWRKL